MIGKKICLSQNGEGSSPEAFLFLILKLLIFFFSKGIHYNGSMAQFGYDLWGVLKLSLQQEI